MKVMRGAGGGRLSKRRAAQRTGHARCTFPRMERPGLTHPQPVATPSRPSADEARERMNQHQPSETKQRFAWNVSLIGLAVSLVLAVFLASR